MNKVRVLLTQLKWVPHSVLGPVPQKRPVGGEPVQPHAKKWRSSLANNDTAAKTIRALLAKSDRVMAQTVKGLQSKNVSVQINSTIV